MRKILLNTLGFILSVAFGFILIIAFLTFFIGWAALGKEETWQDERNTTTHRYRNERR